MLLSKPLPILRSAGVALILIASICSCSKKDKDATTADPLSSEEKKIVGTWHIESETTIDYDSNGDTLIFENLNPCQTDDVYTFRDDRTYTVTDGAMTCTISGYDKNYKWRIETDGQLEYPHGPNTTTRSRITELNVQRMVLIGTLGARSSLVQVYKKF